MPIYRAASQADLAALWELRTRAVRAGCSAHYPPAVIEAWCASPAPASMPLLLASGGAVLAEEARCVVGYAVLDLTRGEIDAAFVDPAHQGCGIALELLRQLEALAQERGLRRLFLSASLNAVPFYTRAGFVRLRDEVYAHRSGIGLASVFMEKMLDGPRDAAPVLR